MENITQILKKIRDSLKVKRNWLLYGPLLVLFVAAGYLGYLYTVLTPQLADANFETLLPLTSKIVDRHGNVLYEIGGEVQREVAQSHEIPNLLKEATIAAEDRDFYNHLGINLKSIGRAALANIKAGRVVEGGSTITQQLVKNTLLSSERTLERKVQEATIALMLETQMDKDEILTAYLNSVSYGSNIRGVKKAAQAFFGKELQELSLAEMTTLAALPQAPSQLSLYNGNKEALEIRRNEILAQMQKRGIVDAEEVEVAKATKLEVKPIVHNIVAPHFTLMVRDILIDHYGREKVENGGLIVRTTLDSTLQAETEQTVTRHRGRLAGHGASNAGAVILDTKTGEILSLVGSFDYYDSKIDGQVNITTAARQPGSSFKPVVYSALYTHTDYSPATIVYDLKTNFGGGYIPNNASGRNYGPMPWSRALAGSLNIPAVKAASIAGVDNVVDTAEALGINTLTERDQYGLAIGLGAGEVRLTELTSAFAALGNGGKFNPATAILSVEEPSGEKIFEYKPANRLAVPPEVAYQLSYILSDNSKRSFIFGGSNTLGFPGHQVAAKTGTSQNFRDGWTMGYTSSRAVGVWTGNNDGRFMRSYGVSTAAPIWRELLVNSMEGILFADFERPDTVQFVNGEYVAPWQLNAQGQLAQVREQPQNRAWLSSVQNYIARREAEQAERERQAQAEQNGGIEPGMGGAPDEPTPQPAPQPEPQPAPAPAPPPAPEPEPAPAPQPPPPSTSPPAESVPATQ